MPDASNQDEINEILDCCYTLFSGTNTLLILDDCAVSRNLKKRSNKFIDLAFLADIPEYVYGFSFRNWLWYQKLFAIKWHVL